MNFIKGRVAKPQPENPYETLGYRWNPFPTQGEVNADVFVPRPELEDLQKNLERFLTGKVSGAVWALSGMQGVGKSNFLHHLEIELHDMEGWGEITLTAYRRLPSMALSPGRVAEEMVVAIGIERIQQLVGQKRAVPKGYRSTDFERFWMNAFQAKDDDAQSRAQFLVRWLSGHQTQKAERTRYGILARERLPPAVAFPYLRGLVEMLHDANILDRIILLLDEFEEVQLLRTAARTEYVQTLKALLNAFNWKGLYVIIAGAPAAFTAIAESYPSLSSRWRVAELEPLKNSEAAVTLANAYKERAKAGDTPPDELPPDEMALQSTFIRLFNENPGRIVTQRDFLTDLHNQVEKLASGGDGPSPGRRTIFRRGGVRFR